MGTWARQLREALAGTPGFAHHLMLHWFELPAMLQQIEDLLEATESLGLRGFEAVAAANALFTFVLVEHSIHIRADVRRGEIGKQLLDQLIARARGLGKRVMVAGIDGENRGSIAFHARFGFEDSGRLRGIGFKFGRFIDLAFMQLQL